MKKLFITLTLVAAGMTVANAQEAFKHLGLGIEAGTTGAGLELALPVVTDHLVLTAGYNLPSVIIDHDLDYSTADINASIADVNSSLASIPGCTDRLSTFTDPAKVSGEFTANLCNARVMLEYYPSTKSSFHIVAGVFIGNPVLVSATMSLSDTFMSEYRNAQSEISALKNKYPAEGIPSLDDPKFTMDGKTYSIATGKATLNANIAAAKPYLGIGFGRSIPNSRVGFQFELGAWYHGKISFSTTNTAVAYDKDAPSILTSDITDITDMVQVYPAMTFRLTVKLF